MKLCKTIQLSPSETRKRNQQKSVTKKSKISVHEKAEKATNKVTLMIIQLLCQRNWG